MVAQEESSTSPNAEMPSPMEGKFTYVGLDVDATGRRLIDEIIHIAAYTPKDSFTQHIMPLMNLNPGARQRHQIRVITVGFFRMLKSMQTYKIIKTKTEIATLTEFLEWLERVNTNDGVIFVYHDQRKFTPYMIIEAMKKYSLMERFEKTVKAFVNGYDLVDDKQGNGIRYLTLSQNHKIQQEKLGMEAKEMTEFEGDATVRAKLSYEICKMMSQGGEKKEEEATEEELDDMMNDFVRAKAMAITNELGEIDEQEKSLDRQSTLRDIFRNYFQASRYHRRRAVTFRRLLADAKHDLEGLQKIWDEGKREALAAEVKKVESLKEEDQDELLEILESHFDPEMTAVRPVVNNRRQSRGDGNPRRRRGPRGHSKNKENHGSSRSTSRRRKRSTTDKQQQYNNNNDNNNNDGNNNNNVIHMKGGAIRKDIHHHQMDANQNVMATAN